MKRFPNNKTLLFVVEGFDRVGKDTLLSELNDTCDNNTYVYILKPDPNMPSYREDKEGFKNWLYLYIKDQVDELIELSKKYDIIIMTRLLLSDKVYSTLLKREEVVSKFKELIDENFILINYIMLFPSFEDYLERVNSLHSKIEYEEEDFYHINCLYTSIAQKLKDEDNYDFYIKYVTILDKKSDVFKNFIEYFTRMKTFYL